MWVYDKIPTGGTKFNISVRGIVRTGAAAPDDGTDRSRGLYRSVQNPLSRQGQNVGRKRNHTASHRPVGTECDCHSIDLKIYLCFNLFLYHIPSLTGR